MKVLHVIPSLSPRHGGPTFAVRGMAHAVSAIGGDVTVAATTADGTGELRVATGEPMTEGGVRYVYFPRQYPKQWSASWPLAVWLRRAVADFDVVHVHSLFSFRRSRPRRRRDTLACRTCSGRSVRSTPGRSRAAG